MSMPRLLCGLFAVLAIVAWAAPAPAAVCGDGIVDAGEQCDDSNSVNGDGCSDACTIENGWACVGEPSTCAATCGNGTLDPGEQCDLGFANCAPGNCCATSCSSICRVTGLCSGAQICCTAASDCPAAQTCCGNGVVEGAEQCDDGNRVDGDCCSSSCQTETSDCVPYPTQCGQLGAVNVIANPSIRWSILTEGSIIDGDFLWIFRSQFNLRDGQAIDPDTQIVQLIFSRNDGNDASEELYHGTLDPPQCPANQCFAPRSVNGKDRAWRFNLQDGDPDYPGATGWRRGRIWRRLRFPYRFRTSFRMTSVMLPQLNSNGVRRARQSLMVGDLCITRLVDCERDDTATRYACRDAHCGDGQIQKHEQCGEPGLPNCSAGDVCDTCRCVQPLP